MSEQDPSERIVVTGRGCISPAGLDVETSMDTVFAGGHGISTLPEELTENFPSMREWTSAMVKGFDLDTAEDLKYLGKNIRLMHRVAGLAVVSSGEALKEAGLIHDLSPDNIQKIGDSGLVDPERVATSIGSGLSGTGDIGEYQKQLEDGKRLGPAEILKVIIERPATATAARFGAKGAAKSVNGACATGNMNIIHAAQLLRLNDADVVIAGGAEAQINPVYIAAFDGLGALDTSTDPNLADRPFHQDRSGFVLGEGASVLVMETLEHALNRGATPLAELLHYGETNDAYHESRPDPEGIKRAMTLALGPLVTQLAKASVYINAHAAGTKGDAWELQAITEVIDRENIAGVSSSKGSTGHMLGAAGAFEALVSLEALRRGEIPPTKGLDKPLEEYKDLLIPGDAKPVIALNNSIGLGGINATTSWLPIK